MKRPPGIDWRKEAAEREAAASRAFLDQWHKKYMADCERGLALLRCSVCRAIGFKKTKTGCDFCDGNAHETL